jgi:hypothetical protein
LLPYLCLIKETEILKTTIMTYSTMTDITMEEQLTDLMVDYTDFLQDNGVKDEILNKFYDNSLFTFSGMNKEQAYNFHNKLSKMYDTLCVVSE